MATAIASSVSTASGRATADRTIERFQLDTASPAPRRARLAHALREMTGRRQCPRIANLQFYTAIIA